MAESAEQLVDKKIRRLRKKLLQIEHLEILSRELNDEELVKVDKKGETRKELLKLVKEVEMKRLSRSSKENETRSKVPKLSESVPTTTSDKLVSSTTNQSSNVPTKFANKDSSKSDKNVSIPSTSAANNVQVNDRGDSAAIVSATDDKTPVASQATVIATKNAIKSPSTSRTVESGSTGNHSAVNKPSDVVQSAVSNPSGWDQSAVKSWRKRKWFVEELNGHEDLILDCDTSLPDNVAVTASRDTTIKVWDLSSGSMVHSLRGHHGPVTGCRIMRWRHRSVDPSNPSDELDSQLTDNELMCVSASTDCSIKLWSLETGLEVRSIYTFNGINKLELLKVNQYSVTGTDGGKLEVFSLAEGRSLSSAPAHTNAVTALSVSEDEAQTLLVSGSEDGIIKVYQVVECGRVLRCLYVSENVCTLDTSLTVRPVQSVHVTRSGSVYYGDNGHNLKLLDWKNNRVSKFSNHTTDQGFTDHICGMDKVLFATAYDVDTGLGQMNLYEERAGAMPHYIATLADNNTSRICVMSCSTAEDTVVVLTGGWQLKVWKSVLKQQGVRSNDVSSSVQGCVLSLGEGHLVVDSGADESESDDDSVNNSLNNSVNRSSNTSNMQESDGVLSKQGTGFCNCSVM